MVNRRLIFRTAVGSWGDPQSIASKLGPRPQHFFVHHKGWEHVGTMFDPENPMKNSMNSMRMCLCSTSCCCHKLLTARRQGSARFFFNVQETPWGIEETSGVQALKMGMTLICTWIATYIYNITNYDGSNRLGGWSKFIQQQEPGPKTIRFLS